MKRHSLSDFDLSDDLGKAVAQVNRLEKELAIEQEDVRFYRNEWENACARYDYMKEERDELQAKIEQLKAAIDSILSVD